MNARISPGFKGFVLDDLVVEGHGLGFAAGMDGGNGADNMAGSADNRRGALGHRQSACNDEQSRWQNPYLFMVFQRKHLISGS